jgi:hypothetical protein
LRPGGDVELIYRIDMGYGRIFFRKRGSMLALIRSSSRVPDISSNFKLLNGFRKPKIEETMAGVESKII